MTTLLEELAQLATAGRRQLFAAHRPPTVDPDYVSPALRIAARREGQRRAGLSHSAASVLHAPGSFTNIQVAQLKADPGLIVDEVGEDGKISLAFDPTRTRAQLEAHLAQDAAGAHQVLTALGYARIPVPGVQTDVTQAGAGGQPGSASVAVHPIAAAAAAAPLGVATTGLTSGLAQEDASLEVAGSTPAPAPIAPLTPTPVVQEPAPVATSFEQTLTDNVAAALSIDDAAEAAVSAGRNKAKGAAS